jgi:putative spermidine/putrescine transport system permease protein
LPDRPAAEVVGDQGTNGPKAFLFRTAGFALSVPAVLCVVIFLLVPVGYIALLSLNAPSPGEIELSPDWTMAGYKRLFGDSYYLGILLRTVLIAASTSLVCAVGGFVAALHLWRVQSHLKGVLTVLVLAPLLISIVARTYGWILILGDRGIINQVLLALQLVSEPLHIMFTPAAVVIGLAHVCLPFMALSILAALERIDPALPEAATTLGAGPFTIFREVIFPLALPGLIAGTTIVFSLSMSSYVTAALMGGTRADVVVTHIYSQFVSVFDWRFGSVLVVCLLITTLTLLSLPLAFSRRAVRGRAA